ncbi:MAG: hypothetical protein HDT28_08050 [Clostridiales bacterium]|nr:hypothetical protein [Clostridiales bacterium]
MWRTNRKKQYILILLLTTAIVLLSLIVLLVLKNKRDSQGNNNLEFSSVAVNGIEAKSNNNDFTVYVPQCEKISLNCTYDIGVICKWYNEFGQEIDDIKNILINGKDIILKYVLSKSKVDDTVGRLSIVNVLPEKEVVSFLLNNVSQSVRGNEIFFALPPKTNRIESANIALSDFFSYKLYADSEKTTELNDISVLPFLSTYYLDIYNVNTIEVYKSYIVRINVQASDNTALSTVIVNGEVAIFEEGKFSIAIDKTSYLTVNAITDDEQAHVVILRDDLIVENANNILISDKESEHFFSIRVTAENGKESDYLLSVGLIYEAVNTIESASVNNTMCHFDGDEISVLLDRTDRITIDIQLSSFLSIVNVYSDYDMENEVYNITNIDTKNSGLHLQYFIVVTAENGDYKRYLMNIYFIPLIDCMLENVSVNGRPIVFSNNCAGLDIIGRENILVCLSDISISRGAAYRIYRDETFENEITDITSIEITPNFSCIYIVVISEDHEHSNIFIINFTIISNDNSLKGITLNNNEYVILNENESIFIESCRKISITNIEHNINATVNVFYDAMQTDPVLNFTDIRYDNKQAELFVRVVAESLDICVYHITIIIKDAPEIRFLTSSITLTEWQESININDLISVTNNSYLPEQYSLIISWDGVVQSLNDIIIKNIQNIYTLSIKIESPYFATEEYFRQIEIYPYTLTPINVEVINDFIEIGEQTKTVLIDELIAVDGGSYILGKHYYIAIFSNTTTEIITKLNQSIVLSLGTYHIRVCPIGLFFEPFFVDEIHVFQRELNPPEIQSKDYYEFVPNNKSSILLQNIFTVVDNENDILLTTTFINGKEANELVLINGRYEIKVEVLYDKGTVERTFVIYVGLISDNTNVNIYINGKKVEFENGEYALKLAYDEELNLSAATLSDKADVILMVNGLPAKFGNISLLDGNNQLKITVVAENGDSAEYVITVNKSARVMPEIQISDRTVALTDNQAYILLTDYYSIIDNDYIVQSKSLQCDGNEIYGDILPVINDNKQYNITVKIYGDFGVIEKAFKIGTIRYSEVKIRFKSQNINNKDGYIFTPEDFIESVEFVGYDEPYKYEVLLDDVLFTDKQLADGQYIVTVRAWQNNILLKEASAVFTVACSHSMQKVYVQLINNEIGIDTYNKKLNFEDVFAFNYGDYDRNELDIYYVVNGEQHYDLNVIVGSNSFEVVIVDISSQIELFAKSFTLNCVYRPTAQNIFASLSINGETVSIDGNTVSFVSSNYLTSIELAYVLNTDFIVTGLSEKCDIQPGVNYIGYTAIVKGQPISCVLEIYNLNYFSDYINLVRYSEYIAENNIISAPTETEFDLSLLSVEVSDHHIKTQTTCKQVEPNIYDITVIGKYSNIDIGRIVVRIFIGKEKPNLRNVILSVTADSIVSCSINEFSVDLILVSDNTTIMPEFNRIYDNCSIECEANDLGIGLNTRLLTVIDGDTLERYTYALNIVLFPKNIISSVEYSGTQLYNKNNIYIADVDLIVEENIRYNLNEHIGLPVSVKSNRTVYNGVIVGYDYNVIYEFAEIFRFSVAALNNNIAVVVTCDKTELDQYGNDKFIFDFNIDKATQEGRLTKQFNIRSIYPYTIISGEGIASAQNGYNITVDFGDIQELELGTISKTILFSAESLASSFDYNIDIELHVSELDELSAPLVITVNGKQKLYFSDADLAKDSVTSGRTLRANIFDREIILSIGGTRAYKFLENNTEKTSITLAPVYDGYLRFEIMSDHRVKHILIPCEYVDGNGNVIDTGIKINDEQFLILNSSRVVEITYGGVTYEDVFVVDKRLSLPVGTKEVNIEFFGYLADDDSFVFSDNSVGRVGTIQIHGDKIIILMDDYGITVPYAVIEIEYISEDIV